MDKIITTWWLIEKKIECLTFAFSFTRIKEDYIRDFYTRINAISMAECDRFGAVSQQAAGGATELLQQDWNEDQQSVNILNKT